MVDQVIQETLDHQDHLVKMDNLEKRDLRVLQGPLEFKAFRGLGDLQDYQEVLDLLGLKETQ